MSRSSAAAEAIAAAINDYVCANGASPAWYEPHAAHALAAVPAGDTRTIGQLLDDGAVAESMIRLGRWDGDDFVISRFMRHSPAAVLLDRLTGDGA